MGAVAGTLLGLLYANNQNKLQLQISREKTEIIESILDSTDYGFAIINNKGDIIEWNPALERMSGWSEKEMRTHGLRIVMDEQSWEKHATKFGKALTASEVQEGMVVVMQCQMWPKDKSKAPIPIRASIRILETADKVRYSTAHIERADVVNFFNATSKTDQEGLTDSPDQIKPDDVRRDLPNQGRTPEQRSAIEKRTLEKQQQQP